VFSKVAGQDATKQFESFHNSGILDKYAHLKIGTLKSASANEQHDDDNDAGADEGPFGEGVPFGDPYWYQVGFNTTTQI
jgi:hypothetical protein